MQALETELKQNPSLVFATIIENNPAAISDNLNTLKLYTGQASEEEIKVIIDNLYNTKQYAKLKQALNVNYNMGVLPVEFDEAFLNVRKNTPVKKSGNGEVVSNYTPLVDSVLDFVCQMLGNCQQQQNPQFPQQAPPFNWTPIYVIGGFLGFILLAGIAVFAFKK